jgi:hypothetical protein
MLNIDTTKMLIEITRGDTASIVFSAKDKEGNDWSPTETTDVLKFAVVDKWGNEPLMEIVNTYDGEDEEKFWTINIGKDDWYEKKNGQVVFDANNKPVELFKFSDYLWDAQISTEGGTITIIGKTDTVTPKFRVWGDAATE